MMRFVLLLCVIFASASAAFAQATAVFSGIPSIKISEGGLERTPEAISRERGVNLACVVSRIGEKYYWASRENKELVRIQAGAFVTYWAVDGSGYIRTIDPNQKPAAALMSETESGFDYVEHLLMGLRSVTYYGRTRGK